MSNKRIATAETQELSLTISPKQFVDYLNHHNADAKCAFCLKGEYGVGPSPSGENAAIVAAPVPNEAGMGLWLFPAACNLCGHTIFFNAFTATQTIVEN